MYVCMYNPCLEQSIIVGVIPQYGAAFGQGNEPTLLDAVRCNGLESRLFDCAHNGIENENCAHNRDAGVICMQGS